jgi:hypothetical protein
MIEIQIRFICFDDGIMERTEELINDLKICKDNYLVYYIFCNNYCIFSDIELSKGEAEILVKFIESDNGFDLLCNEGIETEVARYILVNSTTENDIDENSEDYSRRFEEDLNEYVKNVEKLNKISILEKKNRDNEKELKQIDDKNNTILESKELIEEYKKLVDNKNKKIEELEKYNYQINEDLKKVPFFIRNFFIKKKQID